MKKIGIIVGSLRKESYNRKVAEVIKSFLEKEIDAKILEIGNLPLYNEDIDGENPPEEYIKFRKIIDQTDGFIFVTPEYNRSYPAAIKNALDVASIGEENYWAGKPGAIVSASPGRFGGFGSSNHLKQVLTFLDIRMMNKPDMYLSGIDESLKENGKFDQKTEEYIKEFVQEFIKHAKIYL